MKLALRGLVLGLALTTAACSGGGGGGGSSSTRKGTGYLKVDLPQMPGASSAVVASAMMRPMGLNQNYSTPGSVALRLKQLITNTNQGENCVGIVESIPFLVCMVESMGINKPGTYEGNLGPLSLVAVVTELSADPDGYDIQAIVKKNGTEVFNYKANTAGTKGEIKYAIYEFMTVMGTWGNPDEVLDRRNLIKWDNTTSNHGIVEESEEWYSNFMSDTTITKSVSYLKAFIDEDNGIADIVQKSSSHQIRNAVPEEQIDTFVYQTRVKGSAILEMYITCSQGNDIGAIALGDYCWDFSTNTGNNSGDQRNWHVFHYSLNPSGSYAGHLVGGTWGDTGYTHGSAVNLTPSNNGTYDGTQTWDLPMGGFNDVSLDSVLNATRIGTFAFTPAVARDWTALSPVARSIPALVKEVQAVTFNDLDGLLN